MKDLREEFKVGDGVSILYWSDIDPATVLKVTKCSITFQMDNATLNKEWKPDIIPGGFAGHCVNQYDQKWIITPDPEGQIEKAYLHKNGCLYMNKSLRVFKGRRKFYDYNF